MFYLALAFSALWLLAFFYLFVLDRQMKDIKRRLSARMTGSSKQ